MNDMTDVEFLNELGATFEADGMFDEADRLRAIANKIAAQEGWEMHSAAQGSNEQPSRRDKV